MKQLPVSFRAFLYRNLLWLVVGLVGIAVSMVLIERLLGDVFEQVAIQLAQTFGFLGMAGLLFVSDTLISPLPPDVILVIIAKSSFRSDWFFYVTFLGIVSSFAGQVGWWLGGHIGRLQIVQKVFGKRISKSRVLVEKYGPWAVVLGAATPVPFSVTCWAAGMLDLKYSRFVWASFVRLPRFWMYYLVIHSSTG